VGAGMFWRICAGYERLVKAISRESSRGPPEGPAIVDNC